MYTVIDGKLFKNMLVGAYQLMSQKYDIINQLNVFPVPDGDTGNNMLNTLRSMYSMIGTMDENEPVGIIAEKAASGAIMGARGNSGVILSQIILFFSESPVPESPDRPPRSAVHTDSDPFAGADGAVRFHPPVQQARSAKRPPDALHSRNHPPGCSEPGIYADTQLQVPSSAPFLPSF